MQVDLKKLLAVVSDAHDEITRLRSALRVACEEINEHRLWYEACQPSPQLGLADLITASRFTTDTASNHERNSMTPPNITEIFRMLDEWETRLAARRIDNQRLKGLWLKLWGDGSGSIMAVWAKSMPFETNGERIIRSVFAEPTELVGFETLDELAAILKEKTNKETTNGNQSAHQGEPKASVYRPALRVAVHCWRRALGILRREAVHIHRPEH